MKTKKIAQTNRRDDAKKYIPFYFVTTVAVAQFKHTRLHTECARRASFHDL